MSPLLHNKQRDAALSALIARLGQDETSRAFLTETLLSALPDLSDDERKHLADDPLAFLVPPPPHPAERRLAELPDHLRALKTRVLNKILNELPPQIDAEQLRETIAALYQEILKEEGAELSKVERERLFEIISADLLGYGPLEFLLNDDSISEIWILGVRQVFITRRGQREQIAAIFENEDQILRIIERIMVPISKRFPLLETARLMDGSHVQIIRRPLSLNGPVLHIQKWQSQPLNRDDLLRFGMFMPEVWAFLRAAITIRLNIVLVGTTHSGKTTLMNALACELPPEFFIVTIQDSTPELRLEHNCVLGLQTLRHDGRDKTTAHQLAAQALHFNPDYMLLSATEGVGLLPLLENGGRFMLDLTAYHTDAALRHLQKTIQMAQPDISDDAARRMLAAGINLIVEISRTRHGARKSRISEMQPDGTVSSIFEFFDAPQSASSHSGRLRPTGYRPHCVELMQDAGLNLPSNLFTHAETE